MIKRCVGLALLTATVGLTGLLPAAQAEVRVSPNHKLDSDPVPFRGRDQVGLAVNPANPQHVVEVNANYLDLKCEASTSFDGGDTWSPAVALTPPAPGLGQSPFAPSCFMFQSVQFGTGQNVYVTASALRTTPSFPDSSILVFKSTNGGATWLPGVVAMAGGLGTSNPQTTPSLGPSYFRPSLSVDAGAGTGGADRVYVTALETTGTGNSAPPCASTCPAVRVAVSNDGAQTFNAGVNASPANIGITDSPSKPVVHPDGTATITWRTAGRTGLIQASRSTDGGLTWTPPVNVANVVNTGTSTSTHIPPTPPATTGASTSASYPRMASDPITGNVYLVYSQGSTGPTPAAFRGADHFISPDSAVWFQRSTDKGATWSAPKLISDRTQYPGSLTVQTRHPTISVSPSGRINVVWHDRRHWYQGPGERNCTHSHIFCEDVRLGDTYYSYSTDGGTTFSPNIRITDRSHNNEVGYDTRPSAYWNYGPQSVTVGGDKVLIGWMDSREGNWDTDTEDIYLAKVDFNATGTAPQTHVDAEDAVAKSVALSKLGYRGGNEGALIGGPRDPDNVVPGTGPNGPASRNASSVVIVNETDVAGALAGTVLARANPGPVLLSPPSGLPAAVKAEVTRIAPAFAFVIGDTAKLSAQVVTDLAAASGIPAAQIGRLSGADPAATAAAVAAQLDPRTAAEKTAGAPAFDAVVIANPASPDAAAVSGLAAARRLPVLYVEADAVPAETTAALTSLNMTKAVIVGGTGAVSAAVQTQLTTQLGAGNVTRRGGGDQYATSEAVITESRARGLPGNVVYFADGAKPMEAVLLGGVVARATGLLALAPAPLYSTATGQATAFGLTGIQRSFLLGPAKPVDPEPTVVPTVVPTAVPTAAATATPTAAPDKTAPAAKLSVARRQKVRKSIALRVSCASEACRATVAGSVRVPKVGATRARTFRFATVRVTLAAGATRKVSLKLSKAARRAIARALRARKPVSAKLTITVRDDAGNSRVLKRTVKFVR